MSAFIDIDTYMLALKKAYIALRASPPKIQLWCTDSEKPAWTATANREYQEGYRGDGDTAQEALEALLKKMEDGVRERYAVLSSTLKFIEDVHMGRGNTILPYARKVEIGMEVVEEPKEEEPPDGH